MINYRHPLTLPHPTSPHLTTYPTSHHPRRRRAGQGQLVAIYAASDVSGAEFTLSTLGPESGGSRVAKVQHVCSATAHRWLVENILPAPVLELTTGSNSSPFLALRSPAQRLHCCIHFVVRPQV